MRLMAGNVCEKIKLVNYFLNVILERKCPFSEEKEKKIIRYI